MSIRIAIWDDEDTAAAKKKIEESGVDVNIVPFLPDEMQEAMAGLVGAFEKPAPQEVRQSSSLSKLLTLDVLLVDENLRRLEDARCSTAEELVPPLRAFVGCPAIVILNRLYFDMDLTLVDCL